MNDLQSQAIYLGIPSSRTWAKVAQALNLTEISQLREVKDETLLGFYRIGEKKIRQMREALEVSNFS